MTTEHTQALRCAHIPHLYGTVNTTGVDQSLRGMDPRANDSSLMGHYHGSLIAVVHVPKLHCAIKRSANSNR